MKWGYFTPEKTYFKIPNKTVENKDQNNTVYVGGASNEVLPSVYGTVKESPPNPDALSLDPGAEPFIPQEQPKSKASVFLRFARRLDVMLAILLLVAGAVVLFSLTRKDNADNAKPSASNSFGTVEIPLGEIIQGKDLTLSGIANVTINGMMQLSGGLRVAPSLQPTGAVAGQIYYDQGTNQLAYFNGEVFVFLTSAGVTPGGVQSLGGATGLLTVGPGLNLTNNQLSNTGVLSVQGQAGNVLLTAGPGIVINGTNFSNSGIISVASDSPNVIIANDGSGNVTLSVTSGAGTITSSGGTAGTIPIYTASQNIENSIVTQSGLTVTISGNLSVVTGGLTLSNALSVSNGGTGTTSLANNGVLVGNGTAAVSAVATAVPGLCLLSTAGAPAWGACAGGGGVSSLNGLTGALSIANASAAGSTITIDDASTVNKGIASFNATNFTAAGGAVNTIQDINTGATPTFGGVNTNNITPSAALTVGISAQTALLQGSTTTITSNGAGNNIVLNSAATIELEDNTNVTGNLSASGALGVGGNTTLAGDLAVNGGDITSTGALNITPGGALTIGATSQALTLQGGATSSLRATSGANTTIVAFTSPTANTTLNFPALAAGTYTICTTSGNCSGVATTLQSAYDNSTSPEIVLDASQGALTLRDNATPLGANLLEVQNNDGTITYLGVTSSGVAVTGTATVTGNVNTAGGSLQTAGTTRIDNAGNMTNIGSLTLSGAVSGGTTITGSGNINTTGGAIQTNSTTRIDNGGNLINIAAITASGNAAFQGGGLTLGTSGQAGSLTLNDGSSNTGVLQVAALGQNTTYILPDPGVASATICLTTGNCAGVGGGVTGTGTANTIPLFTGSQTIGDSIITQVGTTIDIAGTLTLSNALGAAYGGTGLSTTPTNGQLLIGNGTGYSLAALANNGGLTITNGTGSIGLAVNYGAIAGTAVQGSMTVVCPAGTGNVAGGGNTITLGSGGTCTALDTVADPTFGTSITTPLLASSGALNITPGGTLTVGSTTQTALLQGSTVTITSTGATNDIVLTSADQIRFTGFNCTTFSNGGALTTDASGNVMCSNDDGGGASPTFQSVYDNSGPASFMLNGTNGGLIVNDNATPIGSTLFAVQNNDGSTSYLSVTSAGISVTGTTTVSGSITTAGDLAVNGGNITSTGALNVTPGGALTVGSTSQTAVLQGSTLTLSSTGAGNDITFTSADQIILNASGSIELQDNTNITGTLAVTSTVTGGTYNGQTISGTASFTGTLTAAGTINTTTGALQTAGTTRIDNSGNLANIGSITASGAATIQGGVTVGADSLAGSFVLYDGGTGLAAHTATLQVISMLAQNTTYILPDPGGASATICLSTGNCAGAGGGITGGGTTDRVAKFTASGTIGDSTITDDGTNVSITGNFTLQGGTLTAGADAQVGTLTLYDGGTGAGAHTTSLVAGSSAANLTFVLPTGAGGLDQCLKKGSGNQLIWDDCDGGAGGSSATLQSVYDNSNPASFMLDGTNGGLIISDNATPIGGTLFGVQNSGGSTTYLSVTTAGISVAGAATVSGNINTSGGTIQTNGTTRIDNSGNLTNIGGLTLSGAISGGTTITGSGNINTTAGTIQTNSTTRIDNAGNLTNIGTITSTGAATLQGGILVLGADGQAGDLTFYDGGTGASAFTGTLQIGTLTQNTTFTLPDPGAASATICLSTGNCAGAGGGVTTSGGTTNRLPIFSGAQTIGDSWLLQNGSTLELDGTRSLALLGGDLTLQGGNVSVAGTISATGDITSDTQLRILESTGGTFYGILDVGDLAANQTFTFLQGGTVVTGGNVSTFATTGVTAGGGLTGGGTTGVLTLDIGAGNGIQVNANDIAVVYGSAANTAVQGNTQITVTAGTNVTGGGTLTLGTGGSLTVNVADSPTFAGNVIAQGGSLTVGTAGQAGTVVLNDGSSNTGTLQLAALAQNTVYTLPDPGAASATICLSTGNCAGVGSGVTTAGGTTNRLAKFSGAQDIADSTISDDGTNVTTTVDMVIQGGAVTLGTASQTGTIALHDGNGQTTTLQSGDSTGDLTFILPTNTGVANQCLKQSGTGNQLVWQDCDGGSGGSSATLQTAYNNSTDPEITLNSSVGGLSVRDNATPISGNLFEIQNSGGGTTYFGVSTTGATVTGSLAATGNINTSGGAIQTAGTTRIDNSGNLVNIGTVTAGTYNGQTISSSASFTGTVAVAGNTTLTGDLAVNGGDITSSGALNITPGGTLTVGATGQQLILQGSASTTLSVTGGGFDTTVGFTGVPVGAVTYNFDRTAAAGTYDICTSAGNCLGVSGSGTIGTIPVFTAGQQIGDSLLSQSGGTVTVNGNLNLVTGSQFQINSTQISSANLSNDANLAKLSASQTFTGNTVAFQNTANSVNAFAIQNQAGSRILAADTTNGQILLGLASTLDGRLVFNNASNANTVTIAPGTPSANRTVTLPDEDGIVCLQGSSVCGFAPASGSANYIQNGVAAQSANFYVQAASSGSIGGVIQANVAGSGDILNLRNGAGTNIAAFSSIGAAFFQNSSDSVNAFTVQDAAGTATLFNVDSSNQRVGVGGVASFSKFEVIGGDAAIYSSGANPRLILGDSTSAGQNGFLQWDSTNDYFRIESAGTNGVKINDNFVTIGNIFPDQPLKVANGSTLLYQISTTGQVLSQNSTDSTSAFRILDAAGNNAVTSDTLNRIFTVNGALEQNITAQDPPQLIAAMATTNYRNAQALDIHGNYAYVVSDGTVQRFSVVDISNPASPVEVSSVNSSQNLFYPKHIRVKGHYAYIVNDINGATGNRQFVIYDISNPNSPTLAGFINDASGATLGRLQSLEVVGNYAYVASRNNDNFSVIDISNPNSPNVIATITDATNINGPKHISVRGKYAYVSLYDGDGLAVIDISNPGSPTRITTVGTIGGPLNGANGLAFKGKYAYVAAENNHSITPVNIEDPSAPVIGTPLVDATNLNLVQDIDIFGDYAVAAVAGTDRLAIISLSTPATPTLLSSTQDATNLDGAQKARMYGRYIYAVADGDDASANVGAFSVWEIGGFKASSADIGELRLNSLFVDNNAFVSGLLTIQSGLNVGGAVNVQGGLNVSGGGGIPLFKVDTSNSRIYVGNPTADSTGALLVLDSKNTSGDPTGTNGGMYYNASAGKMRCYENGAWKDCLGMNMNLVFNGTNGDGTVSQWLNMPAALTEFWSRDDSRMRYDLTDATQVRLQASVDTVAASGAELRVQYSTDQSSWSYLDGGTGPSVVVDSGGLKVSGWATVTAGAKGDVFLRIVGINGDGTADPRFGLVQVQVR